MAPLFIGYARVSTDQQDLTAQREALVALGVSSDRIYVDHGLTGTNRDRPGLREALAACREGDTLVVTKLDRLAARRSRDSRRPHPQGGQAQPRWLDPRPDRPGRAAAVQHAGDGRRVRSRPHPPTHPRRHARRQGQGPPPRQANQAQPAPRGAPRRPCTAPASTAPPSWATCSASYARPSTAPSNATNGVTPSTRAASAELTPRLDNGWRSELASGPLPWPVVSSQRVPGGVVHKLPADLRKALIASTTALDAWKDITPLARNEFICWVEDAKQEMTRERRIRRTQEELEEGQRRPCCWPGCKHRERTGR